VGYNWCAIQSECHYLVEYYRRIAKGPEHDVFGHYKLMPVADVFRLIELNCYQMKPIDKKFYSGILPPLLL